MGEKANKSNQLLQIIKDFFVGTAGPKGISSYELDDAKTPEDRKKVFDRYTEKRS